MSKKINDQIFEENAELLNDVAYVDYTIGGLNPQFGWADVSTAFCDSMLFWCLTCASLMRKLEEIGRFLSLVRARFAMVTAELSGVIIKYVYSGLCGERLTVFPIDKIAIKVSFQQQLPLETVIRCVREVIRLLEESTIILHDIDISVDCAFISTRAIIKDYLSKLGVTESDIADKVKDVGLNCISWRGYTTSVPPVILRTKIYNKFVQMLESTDVRSSLGSQLANLIINPCPLFAQKLQSFPGSGTSRIEITFYSLTVDEIRRFFAVYVRDTRVFAYCHWWNSITGQKQGMSRSNIDEKEVIPLLSNFSFNHRPIHFLTLATASDEVREYAHYELNHYRCYTRVTSGMTLVPALNNSLYPYRSVIPNVPSFDFIRFLESSGIRIEWPSDRLFKASNVREAPVVSTIRLVDSTMESHDMHPGRQSNDGRLFVMENYLRPSDYRPDYNVLEERSSYGRRYTYKMQQS